MSSEMPTLNSVKANYVIGHSDNTEYNSFAPRRVSVFDTSLPWVKTTWPEDNENLVNKILSENKEYEKKDKEIRKLEGIIKTLKAKLKGESKVSRRLVKVIIVDPNENLSLEDAVLVNESEKITDLDDNEIFFDMDIKSVLEEHNGRRIHTIDKKASKNKDKDVYLEPIKIRDLNMSVITIATF